MKTDRWAGASVKVLKANLAFHMEIIGELRRENHALRTSRANLQKIVARIAQTVGRDQRVESVEMAVRRVMRELDQQRAKAN